MEGRRGAARRDRLFDGAQGLVQAADEGFSKTRGKRRAGQLKQVADTAQADAAEPFGGGRSGCWPGA